MITHVLRLIGGPSRLGRVFAVAAVLLVAAGLVVPNVLLIVAAVAPGVLGERQERHALVAAQALLEPHPQLVHERLRPAVVDVVGEPRQEALERDQERLSRQHRHAVPGVGEIEAAVGHRRERVAPAWPDPGERGDPALDELGVSLPEVDAEARGGRAQGQDAQGAVAHAFPSVPPRPASWRSLPPICPSSTRFTTSIERTGSPLSLPSTRRLTSPYTV